MKRRLLLALLFAAAMPPVFAASPINVTADQFVVDQAKSEATFTGNVVVTRSDLTMWAGKVVVQYGQGGVSDITQMLATGGVRLKTSGQDATGERATFDPRSHIFRLSGNVIVTSDSGTLTGPELVLNLEENTTTFSSTGGGRVTGVFSPQ